MTVRATVLALACTASFTAFAIAETPKVVHVQPGELAEALEILARQCGVYVIYPSEQLKGMKTQGASGSYEPRAAFQKLIDGTPLILKQDSSGAMLIVVAPSESAVTRASDGSAYSPADWSPRDKVEFAGRFRLAQSDGRAVSDAAGNSAQDDAIADRDRHLETIIIRSERLPEVYGGGQVARGNRLGLLGNLDVMETPFSTVNYTNQMMRNLGARNLVEVLISDSSVRTGATTSRSSHTVYVRGFDVSAPNVSFDGLYGAAPPLEVAPETVERVELLKGPSALLNGMPPNGQIGGSINVTPKRARARPNLDFTASWYSDSEVGGHLDVGRRFGSEQQFGMRFNGVYRDGDTSLDANTRETVDALVGLDYASGNLRVSGDFGYQDRNYGGVDADHTSPAGVPEPPDADVAYLQPWSTNVNDAKYGSVRVQYDIGDNAMVYAATGTSESETILTASFGRFLNASGDFTERFWVNRRAFDTTTAEAGFRLVVDTGPVEHRLAFAALRLDQEFRRGQLLDFIPQIASNLYNPVRIPRPANIPLPALSAGDDSVLTSFAFADTLGFADDRVLVTLGLRSQSVEVATLNNPTLYDKKVVSPAAGLVFKARKDLSLYANYSEGLSRGPTAPGTAANAGEVFPPFQTEQFEAGVKLDHGGAFLTTLAVFQIAQPSSTTDPATLIFSTDGERRHRGIELSTFGEPVKGLRLLGGITLMDPELTRTQGGLDDGNMPASISKRQVSLGSEWDAPFLEGLTFTARGIYTSSFYANNQNTLEMPSWTTLDVGGRFAFEAGGRPAIVRLNVENVFNESYWNSGNYYRGSPRTILMSGSVSF